MCGKAVCGNLVLRPDFLRSDAFSLLCYPSTNLSAERIGELEQLGIVGFHCFGPKHIHRWRCLGMGYCGLVLLVQLQGQVAALKVRRTDAPQDDFEAEASGLAIANQTQVGPSLIAHTQNFLLMDYAPGQPLSQWLSKTPRRDIALRATRDLLAQAFRLDQAGIDHGNLRCVTNHVVINNHQPTILDFSSASFYRRAANVTTMMQGLFWGTVIAQQMQSIGLCIDKESSIQQLRRYKKAPRLDNFERLLDLLN